MKRVLALAAALSLLGASAKDASAGDIDVMTQNQFLGADLTPLLLAIGTPQLEEVLSATLAQMADNNFPVRAQALAEQICDKQSDVVGLQEVFRFELNGISGPPAPLPFVDHLDELMAAIGDQCDNYVVAASIKNSDVADTVPGIGTVRFTDRDVILTRLGVFFLQVPFSGNACLPTESGVPGVDPSGCHYQNLVPLPPAIGGSVLRGYLGVDALVGGTLHRVVNTHLEVMFPSPDPLSMFFQAAQATELITVLNGFPKPPGARTIVVGDINSSPDDAADPTLPLIPPYAQFATGLSLVGAPISPPYTDAWNVRRGRDPGFTCCHAEDLSDPRVDHDERIDVIFSLEEPRRVKANVLGGDRKERIRGLWPSDHCSVEGDLTF